MPRILVHTLDVPEDVIDTNRHVNNLAYVRWMQEVAIMHSAARGWPVERYVATGTAWVVRSHFVEYLRPAFAGERLSLHTWVSDLRSRSSTRRYLFWRPADRVQIARAETVWVFVDAKTGRAREISPEMRDAFEIVTDKDPLKACGLTEH
jgi:acyl-CoA thioester hydrolase